MDKIKVKICTGGRCFMQGGSDLLTYNEFLDESLVAKCDFEECNCLGECKKAEKSGLEPPFAVVNGKVHDDMTPQKLYRVIMEQ